MRIPPLLVHAAAVLALASATPAGQAGDADAAFFQRARVAQYAVQGAQAPGPGHEALGFWADAAGATRVRYAWGAQPREIPLAVTDAGDGDFALRFPNGLVLDVTVQDDALRVRDRSGGYDKRFEWKYEGPVAGRGTACGACVDEPDAADFVRRHFAGR